MNKFSLKRLKAEYALRKIEQELDEKSENQRCFFYRSERKSEYHHIVPKSEGLKWIAMEANLIPIGLTAHHIIHAGINKEIICLPRFNEYLAKMKRLNEEYYQRYILKLSK